MAVSQIFIVRRGSIERFQSLTATFGGPPISARILWDRRQVDRRARASAIPADRRRLERRGPEPGSWSALDFLVASPAKASESVSDAVRAPATPVAGDLLVIRETSANGPCSVSTVPDPAHALLPSYEEALAYALRLADRVGVDVWYTGNHRVFTSVRRGRVQPAVP